MWNFEDEGLRDHALITQAQWRRVLAEGGFEDVVILTPGEPDRGGVSQQCVILARRSARRHWLLSHDDAALAAELRARLGRLWRAYLRVMSAIAAVMGTVILTLQYFILLPPFALLAKRAERREPQGWTPVSPERERPLESQY